MFHAATVAMQVALVIQVALVDQVALAVPRLALQVLCIGCWSPSSTNGFRAHFQMGNKHLLVWARGDFGACSVLHTFHHLETISCHRTLQAPKPSPKQRLTERWELPPPHISAQPLRHRRHRRAPGR